LTLAVVAYYISMIKDDALKGSEMYKCHPQGCLWPTQQGWGACDTCTFVTARIRILITQVRV